MKKRIEITHETDRVWFVRGSRKSSQPVWCVKCAGQSETAARAEMATAIEAAAVAGVDSLTIYRWVGAEALHFTESDAGLLHVCLNSLPKYKE